jgi:hypothetical protein
VKKYKIIAKIRKLLELADSNKNSNLEEAAAAAAKAQALMEKHRIEKAMVHQMDPMGWIQLVDKGKPSEWKLYLIASLAKNNGCYVVRSADYMTDNRVQIVGEELDRETVQQLYTYLVSELNKLCIAELISFKSRLGIYPDQKYANSFYLGAASTIDSRVKMAKQLARDQELKKASSSEQRQRINTALAVIDNKAGEAKDWVQGNLKATIESVPLSETNSTGYTAGQEAGKHIKLDPEQKSLKKD